MRTLLCVKLSNGDKLVVHTVNGSDADPRRDIVCSRGEWVHVMPEDRWVNTAQIVSIEEVE